MESINRFLPNDAYEAALNSTSPGSSNAFVTESLVDEALKMESANVVYVTQLSDFPAQSGGFRTLVANTTYIVTSQIILDYPIVMGNGTTVRGTNVAYSRLVWTGAGALFRGTDVQVTFRWLQIVASGATSSVYDFDNIGKTLQFFAFDMLYVSCTAIGDFDGYAGVNLFSSIYRDWINGITIKDCSCVVFTLSKERAAVGSTGTFLTIPSGSIDNGITISNSIFDTLIGTTALDITEGLLGNFGAILSNSFFGVGTYLTGLDEESDNGKWEVIGNNNLEDFIATASMHLKAGTGSMSIDELVPIKITGNTTTAAALKRFTHTSPNRLTYTGIKPIKVLIHVSLAAHYTSGGAWICEISVRKNGALITGSTSAFTIYSAEEPGVTNVEVDLFTNDYIEVWVEKVSGTTPNITNNVFSYLNVQIK